jgi:hypothetical protein
MHTITQTDYGFLIVYEGFMKKEDMEAWTRDMGQYLSRTRGPFGILVDLRGAVAFPQEAQEALFEGIQLASQRGLQRCAVVVSNAISKIQATRIAKESKIYDRARFIDSAAQPNWEQLAQDWIQHAKSPGAD